MLKDAQVHSPFADKNTFMMKNSFAIFVFNVDNGDQWPIGNEAPQDRNFSPLLFTFLYKLYN